MNCAVCGEAVPADRLSRHPRTLTCSPGCSSEHTRRLRAEANKRGMRQVRERSRLVQQLKAENHMLGKQLMAAERQLEELQHV